MKNRTGGEIAYEAFTSALLAHKLHGHESAERWEKLPRRAQEAWEAAARAVQAAT